MIEELIQKVIESKNKVAYINLDKSNNYKGWVSNFNIVLPKNTIMELDLSKEEDLFLLFVIASAWSRTGKWENAAYFVTYIKYKNIKIKQWLDEKFLEKEKMSREDSAFKIVRLSTTDSDSRQKVSFREDFYNSIFVLAKNWNDLKSKLEQSNKMNDYLIFINYIRSLNGLGARQNRILIKIPLILRELRCQRIYNNIPGKYCCVVDKRVKETAKRINFKLPTINSLSNMLKASEVVYNSFGDLYDIPLFAYEDIYKKKANV